MIRSRLGLAQARSRIATSILDHLSFGVVQLAADGRCVEANRAALQILRETDGLGLDRTGILRAELVEDDRRLHKAVHAAGRVTSGSGPSEFDDHLRIRRPSGRQAYVAILSPLGVSRTLLSSRQPAVLLLITDPSQAPRLDPGALTKLFGLTPSEARLVSLLATGQSLPTIARQLGIGFETTRTLLARARAKTGTSSQVELVRTVLTVLLPTAQGSP